MSFDVIKITGINLPASSYTKDGGDFVFELNGDVEQRWAQIFSDTANTTHYESTFLSIPKIENSSKIVLKSNLEGDFGLQYTNYHLQILLRAVNHDFRALIEREAEEKAQKDSERKELENKVLNIIKKLTF
ncbi:hypothetical protein [Pectobacterium polaris]|uniref:hypothetical protein n=1 Tax=Pectobacterium polaris TaxID=2042057 RepID=UPI0015820444|nr:hypothetical protein [Pectobacterium polaris]